MRIAVNNGKEVLIDNSMIDISYDSGEFCIKAEDFLKEKVHKEPASLFRAMLEYSDWSKGYKDIFFKHTLNIPEEEFDRGENRSIFICVNYKNNKEKSHIIYKGYNEEPNRFRYCMIDSDTVNVILNYNDLEISDHIVLQVFVIKYRESKVSKESNKPQHIESTIYENGNTINRLQTNSYWVWLYVTGTKSKIEQLLSEFVSKGDCVTMEPVRYFFAGGIQDGFRIGFINYARFPKESTDIKQSAIDLGLKITKECYQRSFSIITPDTSEFYSFDKENK